MDHAFRPIERLKTLWPDGDTHMDAGTGDLQIRMTADESAKFLDALGFVIYNG
ncbi:hypothetical protein GCM10008014_43440 [Paenibacillus silvae]|uniref:Uncharacterized protein n=1 Tax=Paenibacillus silvae TaxID=1325358 RepID=A0ABQ1ZG52_9BACL|nr:hypothetical protein GCM10008014_43440 [Paenibacillus silvae]